MINYSAQGSITVKRLRTGGSLYITLENNGIPLYQGVEPTTGKVSPDWGIAENQPIITPKVTSTRGHKVTLKLHRWEYNGVALLFNEGSDWINDSTGKFQMNVDTGALRIIKNLASKENVANDTLTYSCQGVVAGVEYNLTKTVDIVIQNIGASSYYGTINTTTEQLTTEEPTATIQTELYIAGASIGEYYVKWYKDNTLWSEKSGQKSIVVGRDDVSGSQLFIAEFYKTADDQESVFRAGIRIIDSLDEHIVVCVITSANKEVDEGMPVTVKAKIINTKTGAAVEPLGATWRLDVIDRKTWGVIKTSNTNTIEVTTTETDTNGEENDVEVIGEVTWN